MLIVERAWHATTREGKNRNWEDMEDDTQYAGMRYHVDLQETDS